MDEQMSLFDLYEEQQRANPENATIQIPQKASAPAGKPLAREKCPYKIPTINEIMKLFDGAIYRVDRHKLLSDVFECGAIIISNQVDYKQSKEREERYKQIMESYQASERKLIVDLWKNIYALLSSMSYEDGRFGDWLGELFMKSNTSNSNAGQFFTPYCVSKACAEMVINKEVIEQKKRDGEILSVSEPACGSGGMILALLDVLYNKYDFNYAQNVFIEASDIDARCVHICYLQLSLAGVPAIVKQQNALTRELYNVWYTPAYCFQYLRFRKFEHCARQ